MFSVASKLLKPNATPKPIPPGAPAPVPPQGAIKTVDTMGGGENPANTGGAPQAVNNSTATNHDQAGNVNI